MKRYNLILLVILFLSSLTPILVYVLSPSDEIDFSQDIIIGTYNLHYGINGDGIYDLTGLKDILNQYKPDMIGFQEVSYASPYNGYVNFHHNMVDMMTKIGYTNHYVAEGHTYNLVNAFSTHYEIIHTKTIEYEDQNTYNRHILDVRVQIGNSVVQILNTHLTHIPITTESSEIRIKQVTQLIEYATKTASEVDYQIMTGDFNVRMEHEGIVSPEYLIMNSTFNDAWIISGNTGEGLTSPAKDPLKRIDFIWVGNNISVSNCNVVETLQSDHFPLFCTIVLN